MARIAVAVAVVALLVRDASADPRIQQLITGYDKEEQTCHVHGGGLAKVLAGATAMLADTHDDALSADVQKLQGALGIVHAYCDELAATLELLRADPQASYKSLEKAIDDHDNKIRALRKTSKQALDDTGPILQRLIPEINAHAIADRPKTETAKPPAPAPEPAPAPAPAPTPPPPAPKPTVGKFPSGRTIELPVLPGTWKLEGEDKIADIATYTEAGTTDALIGEPSERGCAEQHKRLVSTSRARTFADRPARSGIAWEALVTFGDDATYVYACAATKTGSYVVSFRAGDAKHRDLSDVAWRMVAAFTKR
jgi:hypothetical protein